MCSLFKILHLSEVLGAKTIRIPDGKGENDCNMFSRGGRDEDCNNSVKSGEGRIQMWGLRDEGRNGRAI